MIRRYIAWRNRNTGDLVYAGSLSGQTWPDKDASIATGGRLPWAVAHEIGKMMGNHRLRPAYAGQEGAAVKEPGHGRPGIYGYC